MKARALRSGTMLILPILLSTGQAAADYPPPAQIAARIAAMRLIAPCMTQRDHAGAVRYALADTQGETDAIWHDVQGTFARCMGHYSIAMQPIELRGALSEALLKEEGGRLLARAASLPQVQSVRMTVVTNPTYPVNLVACAAAAEPARAADLLVADSGTPEEARRVAAFRAPLAECMPVTQRVDVQPSVMRTLAATALYHRVTSEGAAL